MKKVILLSLFFVFGTAFAHEGHVHKIMGTVATVDQTHVEVKTTQGKTISIDFSPETIIHQGDKLTTPYAIKVGEKIVIHCMMTLDGKMVAQKIKLPIAKKK